MGRTIAVVVSVTIALAACVPAAGDYLINFDQDPDGNSLLTGTEITDSFSSYGLRFGSVASGTYGNPGTDFEGDSVLPGGYVGNSGHANHYVSAPNVVSFRTALGRNWRIFRDDWAYGYVDFLEPNVTEVSIVASFDLPFVGYTAYAVAWLDDGSSLTDMMTTGRVRETLSLNAGAGRRITRLEYHGQGFEGTETGAYFDNLRFETPEPGSLLMLCAGVAALAFIVTRRRHS